MKIIQRPAAAAVTIALGLVVLIVGASLLMLRDGGWPWHASIGGAVDGSTSAEIIDDDGTAYQFTGSSTEARSWLDHKQDELRDAHGITRSIAVGKVLQPVGLAVVLLGVIQLFWGLTSVRRTRRSKTPLTNLPR